MSTAAADDLSKRIQRLEDIEAIRRLVSRYAYAMDENDLDLTRELFVQNGSIRWPDEFLHAEGIDAIVNVFRNRFAHPSFHVTHDHLIDFDPDNPDRATGLLFAHAEAYRDDGHYVVATRYRDVYVRDEGVWRFAERIFEHLYFVPAEEYPGTLGRRDRIVTPAGRREAHWPDDA